MLVLIVDDDPDVREIHAYVLARAGFQVREAENGIDALALARSETPPDVILLDGEMPVMSGDEAALRLREDPATRHLPIAMLSGRRRRAGDPDACDAYLEKPCAVATLVAVIRRLGRLRNRPCILQTKSA